MRRWILAASVLALWLPAAQATEGKPLHSECIMQIVLQWSADSSLVHRATQLIPEATRDWTVAGVPRFSLSLIDDGVFYLQIVGDCDRRLDLARAFMALLKRLTADGLVKPRCLSTSSPRKSSSPAWQLSRSATPVGRIVNRTNWSPLPSQAARRDALQWPSASRRSCPR